MRNLLLTHSRLQNTHLLISISTPLHSPFQPKTMEPKSLLLLSLLLPILSLIISPSATAVSVPTAAPSPSLGHSTVKVPASSPGPSHKFAAFAPSSSPVSESPFSGPSPAKVPTPSPVPSQNYISGPPSSSPPTQPPSSPASTNHDLESICKSTDYPDLCVSAISPILDGPTDPETVVGCAIKAAMEHVKSAASLAEKLASMPSPFASVLADCKDSYDDALENFEDAMKALDAHDVGTMNSMLSAAITDFSDSDDGLFGKSSPLSDMNSALVKLTSNCLAIASLIH